MMKHKIIALVWICLFGITAVRAQTPFQQELAVGVSGGVNFSSVGFAPKVYQGKLMGINAGTTIRWITEPHLGLLAELNFTQQGWKEQFPDYPDAGYEYSRTINYIELPFMTHIYMGSNKFRFYINLGPKIGYAISESTSQNLNGAKPNKTNNQHTMPVEYKFDWGACGGPGLELRTGIGSFLLEGRVSFSLGNLYGNKKEDVFAKSNSMVFSGKIIYLIRINK